MKMYKAKIKSICPMLHHGAQSVGMESTTVKKKKGGNALVGDPNEWKKTIYYNEENGVYLPAINVEASMIIASKQFKLGRGTVSKYFKSGVFITEDYLPFYVKGKTITDLNEIEIDKRTVKNPSTRGRNMRYRAIFREWESEFKIMVTAEDYIDRELLKEVISYAGMFVAVGDYRPRFGRFQLVELKEITPTI